MSEEVTVSVIVPFCGEWPSVKYTLQALTNELERIKYEIIFVNNWIENVEMRVGAKDASGPYLQGLIDDEKVPELRLLSYTEKLSHWNAKNEGIKEAKGKYLFFCDAHVMFEPRSLQRIFFYYIRNEGKLNGSLHLPICYMNDQRRLIYRAVYNYDLGLLHYRFQTFEKEWFPKEPSGAQHVQVAAMSSCGMLISKELMESKLLGWPHSLGIYGGGENYMNYVSQLLGLNVNVFVNGSLYHDARPRDYYMQGEDWLKNRMIAAYCVGGEEFLFNCTEGMASEKRASYRKLRKMKAELLNNSDLITRRKLLQGNLMLIPEWAEKWEGSPFMEKSERWK